MSYIMEHTYPMVAIRAIQAGKLEGQWEVLIAEQLEKDFKRGSTLPGDLLRDLGFWRDFDFSKESWLKVGCLIRATEP